jgi:hypothetical protein
MTSVEMYDAGHAAGYSAGEQCGYDRGKDEGVRQGWDDGHFSAMEEFKHELLDLLRRLNI